jgi:hypothetical protein
VSELRAAVGVLTDVGAALEAARARLALAEALATVEISPETRRLLTEARAQFAASGAVLDLDQAEQLAATWESH